MQTTLRHLNALKAFESAAKHSSFSKAALELNISQTVVSRHIKNLEMWLGSDLFIRYGNRIELSEAGRMLAPQIACGFQTLRDGCESILRSSHRGTITVSAEPAVASRWLRKKITEFCHDFPSIHIDIKPAHQPVALSNGQIDVIVHFEERMPSVGISQDRLFSVNGFPACSPELYERIKASGVQDLNHHPLIHDNGRQIWQQWFAEHQPSSRNWEQGTVYADLSMAIDAAVDGEGILLADEIICQKELTSGALVKLDNREICCTWYSIGVDECTPQNSAAIRFKDWLAEQSYRNKTETSLV